MLQGMRILEKGVSANYGMRNHYFGYQYKKPVASLEDFDKETIKRPIH